jgi:VCBS repeat-containing protein
MGIFRSPRQPDPKAVAAAQSGVNRDAAVSSQLVNAIDQRTPYGDLTYSQNGSWSYTDSDGKTINVPRLVSTQTLSPIQREAVDYEMMADRDTNRLATTLLGKAQQNLSTPTDYSEDAIRARTDRMVNPRVEERFTRDRAALETALTNRGIRVGSQAYTDAMGDFERGRTDAYVQEGLANRQQAIQELGLPQRDAINNIGALLGTGQVQGPQFVSTPRANVAAPDYAGMVYQNYQGKVGAQNAALGGLFGLGGSLISAGQRAFFPGK